MKWINPGHEFDKLAEEICDKQVEYYLWGAGETGEYVYELLRDKFNIKGFIDSDKHVIGNCISDIEIKNPQVLKEVTGIRVIVTTFTPNKKINQVLEELGFILNKTYFNWYSFTSVYFSYIENKLTAFRMNIVITEKCTLNCKECIMHVPYIKNKKDYKLQKLKLNTQKLFDKLDYVKEIQITGGETFLYQYLAEYLEFVGDRYANKISKIIILTNGTVIPSNEVLNKIHKYGIEVHISDYQKSKSFNKTQKLEHLYEVFKNKQIAYRVEDETFWWQFQNSKQDLIIKNEEKLYRFYEECPCGNLTLIGDKLYGCSFCGSEQLAGLMPDEENDYIKISELTKYGHNQIIEFFNYYTQQGALSSCKKCYGEIPIIYRIIDAAEQI